MQEKFRRYFDGLWSLEKILVKLLIVGLIVPALLALRFQLMQIDNKNLPNDDKAGRLDLATETQFIQAIAEIKKDSSTLEAGRLDLVANQLASEKEYIDEMQGRTGSPGYGPRAKQLGELRNSMTQKLIDYDARMKILMNNLIARREQLISQYNEELLRNKMRADKNYDLFQPSYISNKIINSPLNILYTVVMFIVIYAYVNFIITSRVRKQPIIFKDIFRFIIPSALLIYGCLFLIKL